MGVSYEFNWYLVVKEQDSIEQVSPELFKTKKQEARIEQLGNSISELNDAIEKSEETASWLNSLKEMIEGDK